MPANVGYGKKYKQMNKKSAGNMPKKGKTFSSCMKKGKK